MDDGLLYEGPHKYDVGDYVIDAEAKALSIGRVIERLSTLPGPAYKVDFPGAPFYKRKLESQLRPEIQAQLAWESISNVIDFENLPEHQGIRSGSLCEAILRSGVSLAADTHELLQRVAEQYLGVSTETCKKAIALYCDSNERRVLAHYRHPHSNPDEIYRFGAFLRLSRNEMGQKMLLLEYESQDRVTYGNRPQVREFSSLRDALDEIIFLGDCFWYTNFVHPDAYGKLPRFGYRGPEGDFVSWKERAGLAPG